MKMGLCMCVIGPPVMEFLYFEITLSVCTIFNISLQLFVCT